MNFPETTPATSLLLTLEEISQLISHSCDPAETLANIVQLIHGRFHTDVCSVYLLEPERGELVLGATIGLDLTAIGRVRMRLDEGLTGLVAQQKAPVQVAEASGHPRFKYFPEAGEDPYHSFLGVPLMEGGVLQGVLVVQTVEPRDFSANECRMLITVGSQLASLVSGARLLERVVAAAHEESKRLPLFAPDSSLTLHGSPLSAGMGLGWAYVVDGFEWLKTAARESRHPEEEERRLQVAIEEVREEITRLSRRISALVGEYHGAILQAQLMLLQDRTIHRDLQQCLAAGSTAEGALLETLDKYVAAFQKLSDPSFQERVYDVKDVFRRLLWHLQPRPAVSTPSGERLVLAAHEASVMDLFSVDLDQLAGVVVERGGAQSHAAILARSLGIPMVGQTCNLLAQLRSGRQLLVDGVAGIVYVDPGPELTAAHQRSRRPAAAIAPPAAEVELAADLPQVQANINLLGEAARAVEQQASGVGLYRTEFLFLARRTLPTEEEQVGIYRRLLSILAGRPASIRTFDLRPDKMAQLAHLSAATASSLDWRVVLNSPTLQKLFKEQIRAILRAATAGPARILVPFVTRSEQLDFVLETAEQAQEELQREGLEFSQAPLGVMIEVAAAVSMVEVWAGQVDFLALGTNDLLASSLGVDRDSPVDGVPVEVLHPGLLHLLRTAITAAHRAGRPITVCGEMAADPQGTLALAALGVDSVSVAVGQLATVRAALARVSPAALSGLPSQLLGLRTADQVRALLRELVPGAQS